MLIIEGMPAERHLAFGSNSDDPDMRDFRMTSHLARYSGVSFGAVAGRPLAPSMTGTGRAGGNAPPRVPAGGAAARPRCAAFNGLNGMYTPVKSGCGGVTCARRDAGETDSRHMSAAESKTHVFDIMSSLSAATGSSPVARSRARSHRRV